MEIVDCRVPLSQIGKTVGPSPVDRFIENVRRHGVVVPVLLREIVSNDGEVQFGIIDGNRRVAAARHLGHADVPARIVTGIDPDEAARLTLAANNFRSANDITEFWAIKHLERSGHVRSRIADDAGISAQYLNTRNRWSTLDRRIFVGFAEGKIAATVANKISRMSSDQQRQLGDLFARTGRVLTADVERVAGPRRSARSMSANDFPIAPGARSVPQLASGDPLPATNAVSLSQRPTAAELAEAGSSAQPHTEEREARVTILAMPTPHHHERRADEDGPGPDIQGAIEEVARMACDQGIALDDLVDALGVAYLHVRSMTKVAKEAVRG